MLEALSDFPSAFESSWLLHKTKFWQLQHLKNINALSTTHTDYHPTTSDPRCASRSASMSAYRKGKFNWLDRIYPPFF